MSNKLNRCGILCAGNFIVDTVKVIDAWPAQDTLCSILSQSSCNGGGPYNILKDLSKLDTSLPLEACGLVGEDANGRWIIEDCHKHHIHTAQLSTTSDSTTSLTDAMSVRDTGRRTFFHNRGANAHFSEEHVALTNSNAKVFYLGYLTLLDSLDQLDRENNTGASRLLAEATAQGFISAVDCVSSSHPQFKNIALAALRSADIFFINEWELGAILGHEVTAATLEPSVRKLAKLGAKGTIVLHMPELAVALDTKTNTLTKQGSIKLPSNSIVGATGAGDAFAAGYLYAIHQDWSAQEALELASCVAAASLTHASPSDGVQPLNHCLELGTQYAYRNTEVALC